MRVSSRRKKLKFVAGITLYNPTIEEINSIVQYTKSFDSVIVYDNSERNNSKYTNKDYLDYIEKLKSEGIIYLSNGSNDGLPFAFNSIIDYATHHFDVLCTLDQDSVFDAEKIQAIKSYIETNDEFGNTIAIIAPYIDYGRTEFHPSNVNIVENKIVNRQWVITSGAFLSLKLLQKYNIKYDNKYFLDRFEIDLCKQAVRKGLKVQMYYGSVLHQHLGERDKNNHINHNPVRHYYLFRNRFYFNKKFYNNPLRTIRTILQTIRHIAYIAFTEEDKIEKITQLKTAWQDYRAGRMGEKKQ